MFKTYICLKQFTIYFNFLGVNLNLDLSKNDLIDLNTISLLIRVKILNNKEIKYSYIDDFHEKLVELNIYRQIIIDKILEDE